MAAGGRPIQVPGMRPCISTFGSFRVSHRRALLIVNRASRRGASDLTAVVARLERRGIAVDRAANENVGAMVASIRQAGATHDAILVAGGDGTLHAALGALLHSGLPLGVLPLGTANDFARSIGLPMTPEAAADVIAAGAWHAVDVARVNGEYFLNAANVGLGVKVTRRLNGGLKSRWGVFSYALALIAALASMRVFRARVVYDETAETLYTVHITVGNGRYYGGGMAVAERAHVNDGLLYLYNIEPVGFWRLLRLLPALRTGRHGHYPEVFMHSGQRLLIETPQPLQITADGEVCGTTPAQFDVLLAALKVFVPGSAEAGQAR